jgi:DNA-binding CsgD family transcriptional regulator
VDSFSTAPVDCARLNELFQQDVSLVPHLIKIWEENRCQAVLCETERGPLAGAALAREFSRLGAEPRACPRHARRHRHDDELLRLRLPPGRRRPEAGVPRRSHRSLSQCSGWIRSQVSWPLDRAGANKPAKTGLLTPRETQILQWIYHGKSNIEIGMILDISPLTVKNHVQKTLRKLNVLNRTQAVGKALALRLVNP